MNIANECESLRIFTIRGEIRKEDYIKFFENMIQKIKERPPFSTFTLCFPPRFLISEILKLMEMVQQEDQKQQKLNV